MCDDYVQNFKNLQTALRVARLKIMDAKVAFEVGADASSPNSQTHKDTIYDLDNLIDDLEYLAGKEMDDYIALAEEAVDDYEAPQSIYVIDKTGYEKDVS